MVLEYDTIVQGFKRVYTSGVTVTYTIVMHVYTEIHSSVLESHYNELSTPASGYGEILRSK